MGLEVIFPGPLATLQGAERQGCRHLGIPASGPADPVSMALANQLVGNVPQQTAIEITLGPSSFVFQEATTFAFAGALSEALLSGVPVEAHRTLQAVGGDVLEFDSPRTGLRTYLAAAGGFRGKMFLGSESTLLAASVGGYQGRALRPGDELTLPQPGRREDLALETPVFLRQVRLATHMLRASPGPDAGFLSEPVCETLVFAATARMDRTGMEVSGPWPIQAGRPLKPSSAVFPGTVQLTPSGSAFILLPDCQTTGGYPHILQIIRADRHLIGQIAPGDRIRFMSRTPIQARADLLAKTRLLRTWLPGFSL